MQKRVFCYALLGLAFAASVACVVGYRMVRKPGYLDRSLLRSAYFGRTLSLRLLLKIGADVNGRNDHGDTPLILAVSEGEIAASRVLIENGADVNAKDEQGRTVLMRAVTPTQIFESERRDYANYSNVVIAKMLLENGADINARNANRETVLLDMFHEICHIDEEQACFHIRFLIANGIDINAKNDDGCTVLNYAAGDPKIKPLLIDARAEYGEKCSVWGYVCT